MEEIPTVHLAELNFDCSFDLDETFAKLQSLPSLPDSLKKDLFFLQSD
jgi:hypothetical protein